MKRCLLASAAIAALAGPLHAADTDVVIALNEELETVEPCMASQSNIGRVLLQNVSETLVELNFDDGSLKPRLAESWTDQGNGTWRLNLRQGVKFSDGTDFDAADVAHSLTRVTDPKMQCEIGNKSFPGIKLSARVVDPRTVDLTLDPPQAIAPLLLAGVTIVPSETPMEFVRAPIGTGPYTMSEWTAGQRIVLDRRDDYWGDKPKVTKATYVFRSDDAVRAAMVPAGEADIVPAISLTDATNPATDFAYPNSETAYVRLDTTKPPLNDIRVRQALNMAVDRDAFIGSLLPPETIKATHITPPNALGADEDLGVPPFDPEKARALIAQAKADGVPVDTEILFAGRTGIHTNATEVDEALQQMFQDAGLNVTLRMMEVGQWLKYLVKPFAAGDQPSMVYTTHDNNRGDPVFSMRGKYGCDGEHSGICDPELDEIIAEATAASGEQRAELWRAAFRRANELSANILLFHMVGYSRVSERLDYRPSLATNGELQLSEIGFK